MADGNHGALTLPGARLELFAAGERLMKTRAVPLPGPTISHTGFLLQADTESLLKKEDAMFDPRRYLPYPERSQIRDASQVIAAEMRRALWRWIDRGHFRFLGGHFKFPGFERIDVLQPRTNLDGGRVQQSATGNSNREASRLIQ